MRMTMVSMRVAVVGTEVLTIPCFQIIFNSFVVFVRLRAMSMTVTVTVTSATTM